MNCRDFDQIWNQALDVRPRGADVDGARAARAAALREHAEGCPSCQVRHRQFETLHQALDVWTARAEARPAAPPPELADRIIAAVGPLQPPVARRWRRRLPEAALVLASAAAVLLAAVGLRLRSEPTRTAVETSSTSDEPNLDRRLLGRVVDDATAASWELALLASEPAARLGNEMIGAPADAEGPPALRELPATGAEPFSPDLVNQMGGLFADGVRPLSTSARRAFGFLRAPTAEPTDRPVVRPSTGKGA